MAVTIHNVVATITNTSSYTMTTLTGSHRRVINSIVVYNLFSGVEKKANFEVSSDGKVLFRVVLGENQTAVIGGDDLKLVQTASSGQLVLSTASSTGMNISINYTDITG
jgi:hypothetical protein